MQTVLGRHYYNLAVQQTTQKISARNSEDVLITLVPVDVWASCLCSMSGILGSWLEGHWLVDVFSHGCTENESSHVSIF